MSNMSELAIEQEEQQKNKKLTIERQKQIYKENEKSMNELGLITITKEKLEFLLSSAFYHQTFNFFNDTFDNWKKENKIGEL